MKNRIVHVTGLPASKSDEELIAWLTTTFKEKRTKEEQQQPVDNDVEILPDCYNGNQKIALVDCPEGIPAFLSKLINNPLENYQMKMGRRVINLEQHFFGFTQLYAPSSKEEVKADVIAITGLCGHAYGSWRGKGELGSMWLRDFLSEDLPNCRTMIYGYDSKLSAHVNDLIMECSRTFVVHLKQIRNTEQLRRRPLMLVAHSLGGVVLAHCLIKAYQTRDQGHPTEASLYNATYGILFFGTPHRGLMTDDMRVLIAGEDGHPRERLLQDISQESNLLAAQLDQFIDIIKDIKVVSFYEARQTRRLQFDLETKQYKRTGDYFTAVDRGSALLNLPNSLEEKIPLPADHTMIVKFDHNNEIGYISARDSLQQFVLDAPIVVANRFAEEANNSAPPTYNSC